MVNNNETSGNEKPVESKPYDPYGRGKAIIPFSVVVKPRSVMGDYIALHGLVPQNELPENLRHKIPENEIWIREDVYIDAKQREQILQGHEKYELGLMETQGLTYKQAHRKAEFHEKFCKLDEDLEKAEKDLKIKASEPVRLIEPIQESRAKNRPQISNENEKKET